MRFIDLPTFGGPEVMQLKEMDKPVPGADEVLIRVAAAGVNRPDIVQRQGHYPAPSGASPVLGLEVAGEVVEVGEKVVRWQVGDKVCALTNGGGYAEYAVAPEGQCLPVPAGLSLIEAAALPETFFTVWTNVFDRAGLKPGEVILIHGGSSGIGTTAIQLAHQLGARVFTTAGTEDKCAACVALGAEKAINYRDEDFVSVVREMTDDHGADVILDMVGGSYINSNIRVAANDGRIVNIAYLAGAKVEVNMMPVMLKRLTLTGSTLRARSPEVKAGIAKSLEQKVWPLIEAGKVRPQLAAEFPLHQAVEAHKLLESGTITGKIVLTL
ncbi:NAD(P)H-quinone oxidoreductase [Microbulbifer sp. JMSA004]|uniref:NAD(P)H-quinone oxidoreductase n=1 Tax=unclassified Microbulbifer TaxID=2619833 RepID=UPI0024AD2DC7|nr:NAD(P)H-quinone oxidoreductase [Microbulbifer sp. VAAF005]WHI48103.1 NAD(P)H-quinone oxidoreductase [Microbulbifer sp. VAAF005]